MVLFETVRRAPRVAVVGLRVTIAERDALLSEATRRGMTITAFVRAALGAYISISEMRPHDSSRSET